MMSSTPVSKLFSKVQYSLNSHCSVPIIQSFLSSDQYRKMREIWDGFASKHKQINGGGPSVGGSRTSNGCSVHFDDDVIYNNVPFSAHGVSFQGKYYETLKCELVEKKSWGKDKIVPTCEWSPTICVEFEDDGGSMCLTEDTITFDLDDSKTQKIPKEAPGAMAKKIVEKIEKQTFLDVISTGTTNNAPPSPTGGPSLGSSKTTANPSSSPTSPNGIGLGTTLAIGAGVASTAYFTYKAYNETRSIYLGNKQEKAKASGWRALGYAGAAVVSGALTIYAIKI